jgi:TatD DNase family protein
VIDTHCHLTYEPLCVDVAGVIDRAHASGVHALITIGTTARDSEAGLRVARTHASVRCSVGIHPGHAHEAHDDDFDVLRRLAEDPCVVAIGETGLDFFHKPFDAVVQEHFFRRQIELALQIGKPLVIHSRDAADDTLKVLSDYPSARCVFHCFTGTAGEAQRILARGYMLSFTGPVTYKKNVSLRDIARTVPDDRIMVETDAPFLSPEPVRSIKPCEPAMVAYVASRLAQERGLSLAQFDALTNANVARFFGWSPTVDSGPR